MMTENKESLQETFLIMEQRLKNSNMKIIKQDTEVMVTDNLTSNTDIQLEGPKLK